MCSRGRTCKLTAQRELDNTEAGMECVREDLKEMRKMLEFLGRRARKVDVKTEVAVKKLERLVKERDEQDDKEREASLKEALTDKTRVVKLVVDKGFGFGKVPTGEIVFIHASVVHGGEVLMIGTDAWVQVVNTKPVPRGGIEHETLRDEKPGRRRRRTGKRRTEWLSK